MDPTFVPGGVDIGIDGSSGGGGGAGDPGADAAVPAPPALPAPLGPDETPNDDNGMLPGCTAAPDVCDPGLVLVWGDIASFRATPPRLVTEPAGWAVRGLPVNFVATASVEVVAGSLLGFPAEVRFTPQGFVWDYGDGSTGRSVSGGASWGAQGAGEFAETGTSHVYASRGEFTATVSVELGAEYRFGSGPWRPIAGVLTLPGAASAVSVKSASTVLVPGSCLRNPAAPGC